MLTDETSYLHTFYSELQQVCEDLRSANIR